MIKPNPRRVCFLTFGGGKTWPEAARRLSNQAKATGLFDKIITETSETFFRKNGEFAIHRDFIENNPRGWGYWIWKPFLILKHLKRMNDGDAIFYLDSGCEILPENRHRLKLMMEYAQEKGCLFFNYAEYPILNIAFCTKPSLLSAVQNEFGLADFLRIPTVWAGGLALVKNKRNIKFLEDWCRYCVRDNYHMVDGTPSYEPIRHQLFEHRHDQSIMSILKAIYDYPTFCSASEFDFVDIGIDYAEKAFSQPFLVSRNPSGISAVDRAKISPGPIGGTSATHFLADSLQIKYGALLNSLGLLK